jgi:hypothetical protein
MMLKLSDSFEKKELFESKVLGCNQNIDPQIHLVGGGAKNYEAFLALFSRKTKSPQEEFLYQNKVLRMSNKDHGNFWSALVRTKLAVMSSNKRWVLRELRALLNFSPSQVILSYGDLKLTESDVKLLHEVLEQLVKEIVAVVEDKNYEVLIKSSLSRLFDRSIFTEIKKSWTLNQIRELASNVRYGGLYPVVFHDLLVNRTSKAEVISMLSQAYAGRFVKDLNFSTFWIFRYYFPRQAEIENYVLKEVEKVLKKKNSSWFDRYILLQLLENTFIKRKIQAENKEFAKPLFSIKRDFYQKLLKSGHGGMFALYNLFLLGDYNLSYFEKVK